MTASCSATSNCSRGLRSGSPQGEPGLERGCGFGAGPRREEERQPAIRDLGREGDILRALGREVDRQIAAQRVHRRLERLADPHPVVARVRQWIVRPVGGHRMLAGEHPAHDVDVLARAGERLRVRLAVPTLDDLRPGSTETQDDAAARQVIERDRRHGRGRRSAGRQLRDRGAEFHVLRRRAPPRERGERVGPVGLGRPDRLEPEPVGGADRRENALRRPLLPVAGRVPDPHAASP